MQKQEQCFWIRVDADFYGTKMRNTTTRKFDSIRYHHLNGTRSALQRITSCGRYKIRQFVAGSGETTHIWHSSLHRQSLRSERRPKRRNSNIERDSIAPRRVDHSNQCVCQHSQQIDQYGHRLIPISNTKKDKISSISSSSVNKNRMKPIGGGYGNDNNDPIPSHLRAYYAIQKDLNKLKNGTKKKQNRIQLDAINTKLHSLFFANERTNIANLSAFQKFFLDRMSVQSVHKDLDWHICLLRPKIHSKFHNAQIDEIINMVADLLRKCVKKFNNKRGHLTSAANTSRIGVGTYGGGKDKSHIQSAFILSKPSSSVPPEFYQGRGASQSVVTPLSTNAAFQLKKRTPQHVYTPSGSGGSLHNILSMSSNNYNQELIPAAYNTDQDSYGSPSPHSQCFSDSGDKPAILNHYDVMTPPASVQMKQEIKKNKKEKQKEKHRRLLSFSSRLRIKKKKKKQQNKMSRPNMSMQEVIALTGLPATKKAKGSDHHNVDEPYPMELFHISDMDFVVVYYVKFLTKFEKLMCELLA
eukprot:573090_1